MSDTGGAGIPAGWYGDPADSAQLRWWDGGSWTAHVAPAPMQQPVPAQTPTQTPIPTPTVSQAQATSTVSARGPLPLQLAAHPLETNTAGVWLLATSSVWAGIVGFTAGLLAAVASRGAVFEADGRPTSIGTVLEVVVAIITWIVLLLAAARDNIRLRQLGFQRTTSPAWVLLVPPLVYLILRTSRVRRESGRGAAPLVVYLVTVGIALAISIVAVLVDLSPTGSGGAGLGTQNTANASSLASGITSGLEKNGGKYAVTCAPFAQPTTSPVDVTCTVVDQASESHQLFIEIDPSTTAGGQPTVKLLSVNPPLSQ